MPFEITQMLLAFAAFAVGAPGFEVALKGAYRHKTSPLLLGLAGMAAACALVLLHEARAKERALSTCTWGPVCRAGTDGELLFPGQAGGNAYRFDAKANGGKGYWTVYTAPMSAELRSN